MVLVGWYCWNNVRPLRDSCLRHRSEGTPSRRRLVCWDGLQMSEMHIPSITCIQYIHYMYIVCMLHVYVIFLCMLYVYYMYITCMLCTICILYVSYMYIYICKDMRRGVRRFLRPWSFAGPKLWSSEARLIAMMEAPWRWMMENTWKNMGNLWGNMGFTHQQVGILPMNIIKWWIIWFTMEKQLPLMVLLWRYEKV